MLDRARPLAAAFALLLAGCVTTVETPDGSAGLTVFGGTFNYRVGGPPACSERIAGFEAVIENDERTGNLNRSVYRQAVADLGEVKAACAAGRVGDANRRLAAVKTRYGYR
ncbi:MAG: hypothetical protein IRZ09_05790 [Variibacter sp.]|nr:hypothetical protein [Variibacter sp.]